MGNSPSSPKSERNRTLVSQPRSLAAPSNPSSPTTSISPPSEDVRGSAGSATPSHRRTQSLNPTFGATRRDETDRLSTAPPPYSPTVGPSEQSVPTVAVTPVRGTGSADVRRAATASAVSSTSRLAPSQHRRALSQSQSSQHLRVTPQASSSSRPRSAGGDGGQSHGSLGTRHATVVSIPPPPSRSPSRASPPVGSTANTGPSNSSPSFPVPHPSTPPASRTPSRHGSSSSTERHSDSNTSRPVPVALQPPQRRNSREDPLITLKKYHTVFIVDDSSSMEGALWMEARNALASLADVAARYGVDGMDVHFLNDMRTGMNLQSGAAVRALFDSVFPEGITPTGEKLEALLLDYLLRLEGARDLADQGNGASLAQIKPVNFIVLTDGAPTDDPESVIVTAARRLDSRNFPSSQVGIQFVQIGADPTATEALKEMDDYLGSAHGVRDMVDTTLYTGRQLDADLLTKILLGGINRRIDRKGV